MDSLTRTLPQQPILPALIVGAGDRAQKRFLEFFLVSIRNKNTRDAYGYAVTAFLEWCDERRFDTRRY